LSVQNVLDTVNSKGPVEINAESDLEMNWHVTQRFFGAEGVVILLVKCSIYTLETMDKLWADRLLGSSVHLLIFSFTMSGFHIHCSQHGRLVDFVIFSFDTEVDAKQRLIVWLNGLEYHVYNRLEQNMFNKLSFI